MSNAIKLSDKEVDLLQRMASVIESSGISPAAAKVMALLTVSPIVGLTFDQIVATLGVSKSAASTALTQLQSLKKVEHHTRLGERRRIFQISKTDFESVITEVSEKMQKMGDLYQEILNNRPADTPEFNNTIKTRVRVMKAMSKSLNENLASLKKSSKF